MRTRAVILAGGEGTRLSILTTKRTKPAVPFGGKYRIIDFALSNCVNSNLFDIMIIAQYRPHSLLQHIGAGGPWDLNRELTGGVRVFSPYRALASGWFRGTADAIQQNFSFIKRDKPDYLLILSGDHIYKMNYAEMIDFHKASGADVTLSTLEVPITEANRFGIVEVDQQNRITSFIEKPQTPPSNLANMGVYLFNREIMDKVLWEDHLRQDSSHDFGKDILPSMLKSGYQLIAYPFKGYWVDIGTIGAYWKTHMDLLQPDPPLSLFEKKWQIYTREEIQPPAFIHSLATITNSLICNGCVIESNTLIQNCVLSPGVHVSQGAQVIESILLNDCCIGAGALIYRSIIDKNASIGAHAHIGMIESNENQITVVGKNSIIPDNLIIHAGGVIGTDVIPSDFPGTIVYSGSHIQTKRLPNEV